MNINEKNMHSTDSFVVGCNRPEAQGASGQEYAETNG